MFSDQFTRSTVLIYLSGVLRQRRDYARCVGIHEMRRMRRKEQCRRDVTVRCHVDSSGSDRADRFKILFIRVFFFFVSHMSKQSRVMDEISGSGIGL